MENKDFVKNKKEQFRINLRKKKLKELFQRQRSKKGSKSKPGNIQDHIKQYQEAFKAQDLSKL